MRISTEEQEKYEKQGNTLLPKEHGSSSTELKSIGKVFGKEFQRMILRKFNEIQENTDEAGTVA